MMSAMSAADKIVTLQSLPEWRSRLRASGARLVVTNGCFDLLHAGHVHYLEKARSFGEALLVGLNSDASVRELKGPSRPLNSEQDRALVLAALECVTGVCIFPDVRATAFLEVAQPDVYAKGGDYTLETLNPEERRAVESHGGRIELIQFLPGRSTTRVIERMAGR